MVYPVSIRKPLYQRIEEFTENEWIQRPKRLPDADIFRMLVDTAFHASFMTEEKRRPGFRMLYCSPEDLKQDHEPVHVLNRFRIVSLPRPLPLTVNELNHVAPAADLIRFLICVYPVNKASKSLHIWGLLDVGENWWKYVHHETSGGRPPPNFLTIASTAPGELSFSVQGRNLIVLKSGAISHPLENPIWSGPISDFFDPSRLLLYEETVRKLETNKWDDDGHDDGFPHRFYNFFLERIFYNVRLLGHGGTIILVPHEISFDDPRLTDRIVLKYPTNYDYAWGSLVESLVNHRRYYDLYFPISSGERPATHSEFSKSHHLKDEGDRIDEEIRDTSKSIASLTSVDGAVVITTRFRVLGFGGEIIASSPTLSTVTVASHHEQEIPIESLGTRHRSAFRFCSSFEDSVAFIVSSDGGVKAAKRDGRSVLFWSDINEGAMGL